MALYNNRRSSIALLFCKKKKETFILNEETTLNMAFYNMFKDKSFRHIYSTKHGKKIWNIQTMMTCSENMSFLVVSPNPKEAGHSIPTNNKKVRALTYWQ